ncbi:P-loop containing nucleoside triphosphate hydrolase protein [Microdochium bolleyi]|uniref:p-loop containing nucleoside triphosphate hydrolase protein n=1 Tax=Microdochium bolleyi TaxID=196109 RepID=A0A136JGF6_9PEZI|nr:P-loop containing nucleoside triphosphate hydrolase protein [Microdochium bolleyi]
MALTEFRHDSQTKIDRIESRLASIEQLVLERAVRRDAASQRDPQLMGALTHLGTIVDRAQKDDIGLSLMHHTNAESSSTVTWNEIGGIVAKTEQLRLVSFILLSRGLFDNFTQTARAVYQHGPKSANVSLMASVVFDILAASALGAALGWELGLVLSFDRSAALAVEAVGSISTVSSLTLERAVLAEYSASLDSIAGKVTKSLSTEFLVLALGFWYGSRLVASGEYATTQFFVIFIAVVFGQQAAAQFFTWITWTTSINKGKATANYMLWLRLLQPSICETDENRDKGPPALSEQGTRAVQIEFDHVDMQYSTSRSSNTSRDMTDSKMLRDLSLTVRPGSYAAFVGASGCGKSTILSLVQRFYDPSSGIVSMNGADNYNLSPVQYRRSMSLVQQEPPPADAWDFILSLPEGLNTCVGTRGAPRLLLLDEATSALDSHSEQAVQRALDAAAGSGTGGGRRTRIAVAHRLSTIRQADVIFVVEGGRIVQRGTHEELVRTRGAYQAMCLAQSLDAAVDA